MVNRSDGLGMGFGVRDYDPRARWEGPLVTRGVIREPGRGRQYNPSEDMGGSSWSGASGRGGIHEGGRGVPREHGGFSNYAGGGARDLDRDPERERERERMEWERERFERQRHLRGYGMEDGSDWSPAAEHGAPMYGHERGHHEHERWMGGHPEPERGPHYGKGPKGYKRSDERIREEVCETIARQGYIDASDVEVFCEDGVVRLVGTVRQRTDKRALEQLAEHVHGVTEVANELRLRREP